MHIFLALLVALLVGCTSKQALTVDAFSGEQAMAFVAQQMDFGPRMPGTASHAETADWIIKTLSEYGWQTREQRFVYHDVELRNLIAEKGAEDLPPIILGAHYDTRPHADQDPQSPHFPVPGANDGASGVAVLLELARVLNLDQNQRPIWLVFFDGEDSGGIDGWEWIAGSSYFAEHLSTIPHAVVIVDMIGDQDLQIYYERYSDPSLRTEIWQTADELGCEGFTAEEKYAMIDDHLPFVQAGIPAVDLIDFDYVFWHTTEDTMDKVSVDSLAQVGITLQTWLLSSLGEP